MFLRRGSSLSLSNFAYHLLCLGTGILGRLAFDGFLRRGSSLTLGRFARRVSLGLFVGRLPGLFLMPARRSHSCKLLLGSFPLRSFPLRYLGQSFFLGSSLRGGTSPGILPGG